MNLQRLRELAGITEAMDMDAEMGGNEMEAGADEMGAEGEDEMGEQDPMEQVREIAQRGAAAEDPEEAKQCCQEILQLVAGGEEEMGPEEEMGAEEMGAEPEMGAERGMM